MLYRYLIFWNIDSRKDKLAPVRPSSVCIVRIKKRDLVSYPANVESD